MSLSSPVAFCEPVKARRNFTLHSQKKPPKLVIDISSSNSKRFNCSSRATDKHYSMPDSSISLSPHTLANDIMNGDELSSKIADNYKQFSKMLTQLSNQKKPVSGLEPKKDVSDVNHSEKTATISRQLIKTNAICSKQVVTNTTSLLLKDQNKPTKDCNKADEFDSSCTTLKSNNICQRFMIDRFNYAAAAGDLKTLMELSNRQVVHKSQNDGEISGTNALMYAAYFGHPECTFFLLNQFQLRLDSQDKKGWTALTWAVVGDQLSTIQLLLDYGASKLTRVDDMRNVLKYSMSSSTRSLISSYDKELENGNCTENQAHDKSSNGHTHNTANFVDPPFNNRNQIADLKQRRNPEEPSNIKDKMTGPPDLSQLLQRPVVIPKSQEQFCSDEDLEQWKVCIEKMTTFSWHQCLPDQMFVFSLEDLDVILDHALSTANSKLSIHQSYSDNELWLPANVIFLSARYAHYCFDKELLSALLSSAITKLTQAIKKSSQELQQLSFWIANLCRLTICLKKDSGLSVSTISEQERLSEVISEAYSACMIETQKRLNRVLEASIMEYGSIEELDSTEYVSTWSSFLRRSSSLITRSSNESYTRPSSYEKRDSIDSFSSISTRVTSLSHSTSSSEASPHAVVRLLSYMNCMLQSYHVPSTIIIQAIAQMLHFISCEILNRMLTYKRYLCRSKAVQIRMNLSVVEDWVYSNKLPASLNRLFEPLIQLLQFLQCLSQLNDVTSFRSAIQSFNQLNILQIKQCIQLYQYEANEKHLTDSIYNFVDQAALVQEQETVGKQNVYTKRASRPSSIANLNCLLGVTLNKKVLSDEDLSSLKQKQQEFEEDEFLIDLKKDKKRDSSFLLPFSVLTTTTLLHDWNQQQYKEFDQAANRDVLRYSNAIYQEIKLKKQEQVDLYDKMYPAITSEWLETLDRKLRRRKGMK